VRGRGLGSTVCFPSETSHRRSVIKCTAIDASLIDENNVYRHRGPARIFITEGDAIKAIKAGRIGHGDVIVLICSGPKGAGMQEIYQVTSALKALPHCKHVAVLTDARFSGVSTGACVGTSRLKRWLADRLEKFWKAIRLRLSLTARI